MHVAIRSVAAGLPRVPLARIPVVAFVNSHPSAYSSSAWSESAKKAADKLEMSAKNMGNEVRNLITYPSISWPSNEIYHNFILGQRFFGMHVHLHLSISISHQERPSREVTRTSFSLLVLLSHAGSTLGFCDHA